MPKRITRLSPRSHVLERPSSYISSVEPADTKTWTLSENSSRCEYREISIAPGFERIFIEILANAIDQTFLYAGKGQINVEVSGSTVSVRNIGEAADHGKFEGTEEYNLEVAFGELRTSSNYEGECLGAGTNGIGAKATNIFSKRLSIDSVDGKRGCRYKQSWSDNMRVKSKPVLEKAAKGPSSMLVTFEPDLSRFGEEEGAFREDVVSLFRRHTLDAAFTAKCTTSFNGVEFSASTIEDYSEWYFPERASSSEGRSRNIFVITDTIEACIADTPGASEKISFTNGTETSAGGVHVKAVVKAISDVATQIVNKKIATRLRKTNPEMHKSDMRKFMVNMTDVKNNISVIVSARVSNPQFNSQSKTELMAPRIAVKLNKEVSSQLKNWELISILEERACSKSGSKERKRKTKTEKKLFAEGAARDANYARSRFAEERMAATLYVVEGKSAIGYPSTLCTFVKGASDTIGYVQVSGVCINALNNKSERVLKNEAIARLYEMIGLTDGVDYSSDENFRKLRYGRIMILADADDDGKHIEGLLLLFFHCRFPSLLDRGFVGTYSVPVIKATYEGKTLNFYTVDEYEKWRAQHTGKHKAKYFKGLATYEDEEIKQDYKNRIELSNFRDEEAESALELAFCSDLSDLRKEWILAPRSIPQHDPKETLERPISTFVNTELLEYSKCTIVRALPSVFDGIKVSQRKCVWAFLNHWKGKSPQEHFSKQEKVSQIASLASQITSYNHGEVSLQDAIIKMAQSFVGSNNMPLFEGKSQFGSRNECGKDAGSARYLYTKPSEVFLRVFRTEDLPILDLLKDEKGSDIEPSHMLPIIPLMLVNGATGIATGWRTFIPNHKPEDVIAWLKARIGGNKSPKPIKPFYRGYGGYIEIMGRSNLAKYKKESNIRMSNRIYKRKGNEPMTMRTRGRYVYDGKDVHVYELPIGMSTVAYRQRINDMIKADTISGATDHSDKFKVSFILKDFAKPVGFTNLALQESYGLSNMVLIDDGGLPKTFSSTCEILEDFYRLRMEAYVRRHAHTCAVLKTEAEKKRNIAKVLQAVVEGELVISNRPALEVEEEMEQMGLDSSVLASIKLKDCTQEAFDKIVEKADEQESALRDYENRAPGDIWVEELEALLDTLKKYVKPIRPSPRPSVKGI